MNSIYNSISGTRKSLIRIPFTKMMVSNIFVFFVTGICVLIDNMFVGMYLGPEALAAIGFYSPVATAIQLCFVIITGVQIVGANLIGAGKWDDVVKLFYSAFVTIGGIFFVFSVISIIFKDPLALFLGARGEAAKLLSDYIAGYALGIAPQALISLFVSLTSFNNDLKRSYIVTATLVIGNTIFDMLLIGPMGLYGVALASSLCSFIALMVILPSFISEDKLFSLSKCGGFDLQLILAAIKRGIPAISLTLGVIIKNYLFNYTLSRYVGDVGVATVNVMATINIVAGSIPQGCSGAFTSLSGLYYGEDDRDNFIDLFRITTRIGTILCCLTIAGLIVFSSQISGLFFVSSSEGWAMTRQMICLGYLFLLPNLIFNIFLKSYQAQGKTLFMNIIIFIEVVSVGIFTFVTVPFFGTDAAWLANAIMDVVMIMIVLISAIIYNKRFDLSLPAILKLSDDFGASEDEYMEFSIKSSQDISKISEQTIEFCRSKNYPERTAFFIGLCIEEMASNVLKHGHKGNKHYYTDVRVVARDELTVRIRDNCHEFDPRHRQDMYNPDSPEKNIGIRLTSKLAKQIDYYNNAGINTLLMKF